jgi:alkylation response protein AidB-like acyl-CoA dehydrogenase
MRTVVRTRTEEQALLLEEVDRFAARAIAPEVARPEQPMGSDALAAVLARAEALGLAGGGDDEGGLGPWAALATGEAGLTLALLERLARVNSAVALCVHQRALARAAARWAGLRAAGGAITVDGTLGLGGVAWARAIAGAPLDDDDRALLEDAYAPDATRILPLAPDGGGLLTVTWTRARGFALALHRADALGLTPLHHAHGLDELRLMEVRPRGPGELAALTPERARELIARIAAAERLGLVAIAAGSVRRARGLATRFAAQRRQGGATIDRHAAVAGLLGRATAALATVDAALEATPLEARAALALTSHAMPALADAANAALQVFGGIGYMRDTGAEKVVRDVNCLRALAGSPRELELVAAELERLDG